MDGSVSLNNGYLEDAVAGWRKRYTTPPQNVTENLFDHANVTWKDEKIENLDQFLKFNDAMEAQFFAGDGKILEEQVDDSPERCIDSIVCSSIEGCDAKKIAYPFDLAKRGGIDGHITLEDINSCMLKPPTRLVKHPVGDHLSRGDSSSDFGVTGKAIFALTRVHTRGRGTITVIRTKS